MNSSLNAYVNENIELAPTGSGNLNGLRFSVKDVFAIKDYTNGAGNPDWLRSHTPATENAPAINKLRQLGAHLKGTVQTDEIMYSLNGENYHYGTPINPKAPDRIPGGSSSGSASAVAGKCVDFALGTDTGGSVRVPSSYCGLYGIRPTHGAVNIDGVIPLAKSFDTVGWMANDSKTLLEVGKALLDNQEEGKFSTAYFSIDAWALSDPECKEAFSPFITLIENQSTKSKWLNICEQGLDKWANAFRILQALEIWEEHGEWVTNVNPRFGPGIKERFISASTLNKNENHEFFTLRAAVREHMTQLLGDDGILVIPTAPGVAPLLNLSGEAVEKRRAKTMQLTCIAGLAGLPQITLPLAEINGCPIGLSIIANVNKDKSLLTWVNDFVQL